VGGAKGGVGGLGVWRVRGGGGGGGDDSEERRAFILWGSGGPIMRNGIR